jgi:hypothetical protein
MINEHKWNGTNLSQNSYHSLAAKQLSLTWRKAAITHLAQNSNHSLGAKRFAPSDQVSDSCLGPNE